MKWNINISTLKKTTTSKKVQFNEILQRKMFNIIVRSVFGSSSHGKAFWTKKIPCINIVQNEQYDFVFFEKKSFLNILYLFVIYVPFFVQIFTQICFQRTSSQKLTEKLYFDLWRVYMTTKKKWTPARFEMFLGRSRGFYLVFNA